MRSLGAVYGTGSRDVQIGLGARRMGFGARAPWAQNGTAAFVARCTGGWYRGIIVPIYFDYNWTVHADMPAALKDKLTRAFLDLNKNTPEGREVLYELARQADVFLTNLLPPARRSMGIDADTIRARFPGIVYASGSGTGPNGPENEKGGYDSISYWARSAISATRLPTPRT